MTNDGTGREGVISEWNYLKGGEFDVLVLWWDNLFTDENQFSGEFDSHDFVFFATIAEGNEDLTVYGNDSIGLLMNV